MSKILGSWSGMRRYLEEEMLSESLRGRVRYDCTTYVGMDGCRVFTLFVEWLLTLKVRGIDMVEALKSVE